VVAKGTWHRILISWEQGGGTAIEKDFLKGKKRNPEACLLKGKGEWWRDSGFPTRGGGRPDWNKEKGDLLGKHAVRKKAEGAGRIETKEREEEGAMKAVSTIKRGRKGRGTFIFICARWGNLQEGEKTLRKPPGKKMGATKGYSSAGKFWASTNFREKKRRVEKKFTRQKGRKGGGGRWRKKGESIGINPEKEIHLLGKERDGERFFRGGGRSVLP